MEKFTDEEIEEILEERGHFPGHSSLFAIIIQLKTERDSLAAENYEQEQRIENLTANRDAISSQLPKVHKAYTDRIQTLSAELEAARERVNVWRKRAHRCSCGNVTIYPDVMESWESTGEGESK